MKPFRYFGYIKKLLYAFYLFTAAAVSYWGMINYADLPPVTNKTGLLCMLVFVLCTVVISLIHNPVICTLLVGAATLVFWFLPQEVSCILAPWPLLLCFLSAVIQKSKVGTVCAVFSVLLIAAQLVAFIQYLNPVLHPDNFDDYLTFSKLTRYGWMLRIIIGLLALLYLFCFVKSLLKAKTEKKHRTYGSGVFSSTGSALLLPVFYLLCLFCCSAAFVYALPLTNRNAAELFLCEQLIFLLCLYYSKDAVLVGSVKIPK